MTTAFLFPGQGSQSIGMLAEAEKAWPVVAETFSEASDALGFDLWDLCQKGPEDELNQTAVTQPAILTASIALWREWCGSKGGRPEWVAGHSLGEYSALVAAESISFVDAVKLVRLRGELMQEAVPDGGGRMAAIIGLDDETVMAVCEESAQGEVVSAVNFNAPGQVVIAGETSAVDRAIESCKAKGAKRAMALPVSVPSHCALMKPAADELSNALDEVDFGDASIPVVQNVTAAPEQDSEALRDNLVHQLYSPVQWTGSVRYLVEENVTSAVECGPGRVLAGLVRRIDRNLKVRGIETPDAMTKALEQA
ncbi:[acyl-carrier-protein] S-malonyltransferase [Tamilnaduibacter salinus]|uniref:Malonyl CoA-acyl carrier protein transacylase n=1 Tax=Tamilnaduibacter salinus TaxID=1484056 RepID=A0A2A2I635_9GAMM|nr:ACP S-malonyltransferase [Tamilnaduibacter salinus]PAV27471.1 [acyl-carrier-protein] S-malonyltransferase [Tamilnaduibacter salinus]